MLHLRRGVALAVGSRGALRRPEERSGLALHALLLAMSLTVPVRLRGDGSWQAEGRYHRIGQWVGCYASSLDLGEATVHTELRQIRCGRLARVGVSAAARRGDTRADDQGCRLSRPVGGGRR